MQHDLTSQVVAAVKALKPGEAIFLPFECVVARSHAGTLRFGDGVVGTRWVRGDALDHLTETLDAMLNPRETGYFAGHYARRFRDGCTLRPVRVIDVGSKTFRVDREAMGLPA